MDGEMKEAVMDTEYENFCMRCGSRLKLQYLDGRRRPVCESCGWVYFKNPASASAAVIMLDGRLVLVKRKLPPGKGKWCLPAGFEEYDETPEQTAVREVKEETNLDVRIKSLFEVHFSTIYPGKNIVVHVYLAEVMGGDLKPGDDAIEVRAFPPGRLPKDIAFKSHIKVIEHLLKSIDKGKAR